MRTLFCIPFLVDLQRMPLYVPPIKRDDTKIDSDLSNQSLTGSRRKKKTSVSKLVTREKTMSANKSKSSLKVSAIAAAVVVPLEGMGRQSLCMFHHQSQSYFVLVFYLKWIAMFVWKKLN